MIYIASPYSSPLSGELGRRAEHNRYIQVLTFVTKMIREGGPPAFSPIVYCHPIALANPQSIGRDAVYWMQFNMAFMRRAEAFYLLMLPGWPESKGVQMELNFAKIAGIQVVKFTADFERVLDQ